MDTIFFEGKRIVRYTDYSWDEYIENETTENIDTTLLAPPVKKKREIDYKEVFKWNWNTHRTYSRNIDLSDLTDTIRINLRNKKYPKIFLPQTGVTTSHYGARWGRMHRGIDLRLRTGDKVHSAFAGKVRYAKNNKGGYGKLVIVRHFNGLETYYAHLSKFNVKENDYVSAGEVIGLGGTTGHSTGAHLHFEVRYLDNAFNPELIFNFTEGKLNKTVIELTSKDFVGFGYKSTFILKSDL